MEWGCAVLVALVPVSIVLRGIVLQWLWLWFIVPFGLPVLTLPWALGLSTCVHAFAGTTSSSDADDGLSAGAKMVKSGLLMIGGPLLTLVGGWAIHLWM
jgi:hypothetical protein